MYIPYPLFAERAQNAIGTDEVYQQFGTTLDPGLWALDFGLSAESEQEQKGIIMSQKFEERLFAHITDGLPLSAEDQAMLAKNQEAQATLAEIQSLLKELAVARLSRPSAAAITKYAHFFSEINRAAQRKENHSLIDSVCDTLSSATAAASELFEQIKANLVWDGRQQFALQGSRGAMSQSYRLLYSADGADIEMLIEAEGNLRHITGEVLSLDDAPTHPTAPMLLHLLQPQSGIAFAETTSDAEGGFRLSPVKPGQYKLLITPSQGALLEVAPLEIT